MQIQHPLQMFFLWFRERNVDVLHEGPTGIYGSLANIFKSFHNGRLVTPKSGSNALHGDAYTVETDNLSNVLSDSGHKTPQIMS